MDLEFFVNKVLAQTPGELVGNFQNHKWESLEWEFQRDSANLIHYNFSANFYSLALSFILPLYWRSTVQYILTRIQCFRLSIVQYSRLILLSNNWTNLFHSLNCVVFSSKSRVSDETKSFSILKIWTEMILYCVDISATFLAAPVPEVWSNGADSGSGQVRSAPQLR